MFRTLISPAELLPLIGDARIRLLDCRASLTDPGAGRRGYERGHIVGALFLDLEHDLSGPPVTNAGRHPLPTRAALKDLFGRLGVAADTQLVAYDASGGTFAARLWWLARHAGIEAVAVLDGGYGAWLEAGGAVEEREATVRATAFEPGPSLVGLAGLEAIVPGRTELLDARDAPRFRGEHEPIDPVAGHIPGARNHPWSENLDESGRFKPAAELASGLIASLGCTPGAGTVHYCGSGVSACHNVLAQVIAGFPAPILYAGSFSEWCRDPARPVATGDA